MDRDWTEDFHEGEGQYECHCVYCKQNFIGHKRRVVCKLCAHIGLEIRTDLEAALSVLPTPQWQPIESIPPMAGRYLVSRAGGAVGVARFSPRGKKKWFFPSANQQFTITHWMPLPDPPDEPT